MQLRDFQSTESNKEAISKQFDPEQNPEVSKRFREIDQIREEQSKLTHLLKKHEELLQEIDRTREFTGINNITFSWAGTGSGAGTITWSAGSVQDRKGNYLPVPSGSKTGLTAESFYWSAWNPIHKVMAFQADLSMLNLNSNNLVLSRIETGTDGNTGTSGGGGSASGGWDPNRLFYDFIP